MNATRILGHTAAATAGSLVWLLGIHIPGTGPNTLLYAVTLLPWLVAALSYVLAHRADTLGQRLNQTIEQPRQKQLTR